MHIIGIPSHSCSNSPRVVVSPCDHDHEKPMWDQETTTKLHHAEVALQGNTLPTGMHTPPIFVLHYFKHCVTTPPGKKRQKQNQVIIRS